MSSGLELRMNRLAPAARYSRGNLSGAALGASSIRPRGARGPEKIADGGADGGAAHVVAGDLAVRANQDSGGHSLDAKRLGHGGAAPGAGIALGPFQRVGLEGFLG